MEEHLDLLELDAVRAGEICRDRAERDRWAPKNGAASPTR